MTFDPACLPTLLPVYYRRLFPSRLLMHWLQYGQNNYLQRREFSFVLKDDVYLRYKSFADPIEFERELYKTVPEKIDIGAVYNFRPKEDRRKKEMCPIERELVFDIDMTDYDDVRTCCKGTDMCKKCWWFLVVAIEIIDKTLEEDFGFAKKLWIFSGRRGVHCWVVDETARKLSPSARLAIVDYLSVASAGGKEKTVELKERCLHPFLQRACSIIEKHFQTLLTQQNWLDTEDGVQKMLSLIPNSDLRSSMQEKIMQCDSSLARWKDIENIDKLEQIPDNCRHFVEEIMLQYAYPRIDANVTKGIGHLLKSPFCVHAKTGKVCIPLDVSENSLAEFNPEEVPRIDTLIQELSETTEDQSIVETVENANNNKKPLDYKRTSLKKYVALFEDFLTYLPRLSQMDGNANVSMEF